MGRVDGKVVRVTGAARGIGRAVAAMAAGERARLLASSAVPLERT